MTSHPIQDPAPPGVPATFDQVEKRKLFGRLDGEGGDRGGGGGQSREAAEVLSLLPHRNRMQLSHFQKRTRCVSCCSSVGAEIFKTIRLLLFHQEILWSILKSCRVLNTFVVEQMMIPLPCEKVQHSIWRRASRSRNKSSLTSHGMWSAESCLYQVLIRWDRWCVEVARSSTSVHNPITVRG